MRARRIARIDGRTAIGTASGDIGGASRIDQRALALRNDRFNIAAEQRCAQTKISRRKQCVAAGLHEVGATAVNRPIETVARELQGAAEEIAGGSGVTHFGKGVVGKPVHRRCAVHHQMPALAAIADRQRGVVLERVVDQGQRAGAGFGVLEYAAANGGFVAVQGSVGQRQTGLLGGNRAASVLAAVVAEIGPVNDALAVLRAVQATAAGLGTQRVVVDDANQAQFGAAGIGVDGTAIRELTAADLDTVVFERAVFNQQTAIAVVEPASGLIATAACALGKVVGEIAESHRDVAG